MRILEPRPVTLLLEHGAQMNAKAWGALDKPVVGEFVFCTAMSGIEESLTDPSFARQILVSTVSHVGNTGFTGEDTESSKIWVEALVSRHIETIPSNWRAKKSLIEWMCDEGRVAVAGVDTRELTILLRTQGSQRGIIYAKDSMSTADARAQMDKLMPPMSGQNLCDLVSCKQAYDFKMPVETYWPQGAGFALNASVNKRHLAVWDFGVKTNTLRLLREMGFKVRVYPSTTKAEDFLAASVDALMLSNGPGDPAAATHVIAELKKVLGRKPMYAICLGHQLVGHALGARTHKMKFGHRGIHHPVVELNAKGERGRVWISSQNHGFAIERDSLPKGAHVSLEHADDLSVEGLSLPNAQCETVQFHPEAAPGPWDTGVLMRNFYSKWENEL